MSVQSFRFGAFTLDLATLSLHGPDGPVGLRPKTFDVLKMLAQKPGQVVSKVDLLANVWADVSVTEDSLTKCISELRRALHDDAHCLIRTVSKRGYRLVMEVEPQKSAASSASHASRALARGGEGPSLVVLPFVNLSIFPVQAYFAEGLSHTISTDLSRISGLLVISSATAATFKGPDVDIRRVCGELNVRYALLGSVQRIERNVRITAQLVDGQSGVQVWSELFDGDVDDLFNLQDQLTGRIANCIGREIFVAAARDGLARNVTPSSLDLVMRGIAADSRPQSLQSLQEQEALFARAVALDPNNIEALARLSRAIVLQVTQAHASVAEKAEALRRGADAAEKAIALGPGNPRGHFAMGLVHVLLGDFERSALANEAAIALDRNFALAHNNLGNSLFHLGRGPEALKAVASALRLDPRGPQVGSSWTVMGFAHLLTGHVDEAVNCFWRACSANPKLPRAHAGAAVALATRGDTAGARGARADLLALAPGYRLSQTIDACSPRSPTAYKTFYEAILRPGAELAGLPV